MNKIIIYILGTMMLLVSCEKDFIPSASYLHVSNHSVSVFSNSIQLSCNLDSDADLYNAYVECDIYDGITSVYKKKVQLTRFGGSRYSATITGLKENTIYYICYEGVDRFSGKINSEVYRYKTSIAGSPSVSTISITDVSYTSATVGGNVTYDGGSTVTERGVVYSTSQNPTTSNAKKTSGSGTGSFSVNLSGLSEGTTYYVRAYAINSKGTSYGNQVSFTTKTNSGTGGSGGSVNNHEYVDLGLSVKWATCNVGASQPEEYGDYFAWGETSPKSTYNWSTYKWCNGSFLSLTKYCTHSDYGTVDYKTQLELSDDAAHASWGVSWRMPTHDELTELREQCTWTWTTQNGVQGYKVTSKTNGYSIFLPAAGYRYDSSLRSAGSHGYYWSSSLSTVSPDDARYVFINSSDVDWDSNVRRSGRSVRPVCP